MTPSLVENFRMLARYSTLANWRLYEACARVEAFASGLDERFLEGEIRYTNNEGNLHSDPVHLLVTHLFNHQTHHRGQVHDTLSQTDVPPPVLDLHRIIRPNPEGSPP